MNKGLSGSVQVLIAEDHPVVRAGMLQILHESSQVQVIGAASDGLEAIQLVHELRPDELLLDLDIPVLSGIQVAKILQHENPDVKIIAFSVYDDLQYIQGVLDLGVAGYLLKDEVPVHLVGAVLSVSRGLTGWLSWRLRNRLDSKAG